MVSCKNILTMLSVLSVALPRVCLQSPLVGVQCTQFCPVASVQFCACIWIKTQFCICIYCMMMLFVRWPQSSFEPVYGIQLNFVFVYIVWWCCLSGGPSPVLCLYYNDFNLIYILVACGPRELENKIKKWKNINSQRLKLYVTFPQSIEHHAHCPPFPELISLTRGTCWGETNSLLLISFALQQVNFVENSLSIHLWLLDNYWVSFLFLWHAFLQLIHNNVWVLLMYVLHPKNIRNHHS